MLSDIIGKEDNGEFLSQVLNFAALENHIDVVKMIIHKDNINVNMEIEENTALINVFYQKNIDIIKLLLNHPNIDINFKNIGNYTPLFISVINNRYESVELLLTNPKINVNVEVNAWTPLTFAAYRGYDNIVKLLVSNPNIDVNYKNEYVSTALIIAAIEGRYSTMKILLEHPNIDETIKSKEGKTAKEIFMEKRDFILDDFFGVNL